MRPDDTAGGLALPTEATPEAVANARWNACEQRIREFLASEILRNDAADSCAMVFCAAVVAAGRLAHTMHKRGIVSDMATLERIAHGHLSAAMHGDTVMGALQ